MFFRIAVPLNLLIILATFAMSGELDYLFLPQQSMFSASSKALGDAGIAFPTDILSGVQNPALGYSYYRLSTKKGAVAAGYGRDTIFNDHIIPVGAGFNTGNSAVAFYYRALIDRKEKYQNDFILNLAGQMSGAQSQDKNQPGPVDFGMNVRYEKFENKTRSIGPSVNRQMIYNSSKQLVADSAVFTLKGIDNGDLQQRRLMLDIGLYQSNVTPNLDFALLFKNLFGYMWTEENPVLKNTVTTTKSAAGDSVVNSDWYYDSSNSKGKGWTNKRYRILTTGIDYHFNLSGGAHRIDIPLDLEILGLFDRHLKNRYIFRGGISLAMNNHFFVRLGYSRAPGPITNAWNEIKNLNVFTGGAGISIQPVTFDFYVADHEFGSTVSYEF